MQGTEGQHPHQICTAAELLEAELPAHTFQHQATFPKH